MTPLFSFTNTTRNDRSTAATARRPIVSTAAAAVSEPQAVRLSQRRLLPVLLGSVFVLTLVTGVSRADEIAASVSIAEPDIKTEDQAPTESSTDSVPDTAADRVRAPHTATDSTSGSGVPSPASGKLPAEAPEWLRAAETVVDARTIPQLLQENLPLPPRLVVRSSRWSTPEEAEQEVAELASQLLRHQCEVLFAARFPQFAIEDAVPPGREFREQVFRAEELITLLDDLHSPMYQEFWELNMNHPQLARLIPVMQQQTGRTRFRELLVLLGVVSLHCGGVAWLLSRREE